MKEESRVFKILEREISYAFTGRINILKIDNKQFLGNIILDAGEIVKINFDKFSGIQAFFAIYKRDVDENDLEYVLESEIISDYKKNIFNGYFLLKEKVLQMYKMHNKFQKYTPPPMIKLIIDQKILENAKLTEDEYDILEMIAKYPNVSKLYDASNKLPYEITRLLVILRQKHILKVNY